MLQSAQVNGQMVNGQWSVVKWSMVNDQWSIVKWSIVKWPIQSLAQPIDQIKSNQIPPHPHPLNCLCPWVSYLFFAIYISLSLLINLHLHLIVVLTWLDLINSFNSIQFITLYILLYISFLSSPLLIFYSTLLYSISYSIPHSISLVFCHSLSLSSFLKYNNPNPTQPNPIQSLWPLLSSR